jgi:hypothetical protein
MNHIQGTDRRQIKMISLEQMVEPESMVRHRPPTVSHYLNDEDFYLLLLELI